ncbi:chemotaxis protein CheW [Methylobacterium oryzisoli]|uniref:chemotaxis protein CheW n=1 Tax=Methylobacterium oryzisoli TaxID=3385502 RepID=UPI0038917EEA
MTASGPAGSADESRAEGGAANGLPAGGLPADRIPAEGIPADEILSPARIAALLDARSRRLAARGQAAPETRARLRTLVCQAGAERFGLPVAAVAEVALFRPCTPVPGAPPALIGLSSRGGALLSVLDLAAALGLDAEAPEDGRWHLVVLRRDNPRIGLRVERALAVIDALVDEPPGDRPVSGRALAGADDPEGFPLVNLPALLRPFLGTRQPA